MKTNAIVRIILYSLLILVLIGILLTGMGIGTFMSRLDSGSGAVNSDSGSVLASEVQKLDIDWAAGSVTVICDDTDIIIFTESGSFDENHSMAYAVEDGTLSIEYSKPSVQIGFSSQPEKDLVITVPKGWSCESLEIDGAALDIQIDSLSADMISLDGAAVEFDYFGTFNTLECDGAACKMKIVCLARPYEISIDGAACELDLTLPQDCGFLVQTDGLGCSFKSNVPHSSQSGDYFYGDRQCQLDIEGMGCEINVTVGEASGGTPPTIPAGQ